MTRHNNRPISGPPSVVTRQDTRELRNNSLKKYNTSLPVNVIIQGLYQTQKMQNISVYIYVSHGTYSSVTDIDKYNILHAFLLVFIPVVLVTCSSFQFLPVCFLYYIYKVRTRIVWLYIPLPCLRVCRTVDVVYILISIIQDTGKCSN